MHSRTRAPASQWIDTEPKPEPELACRAGAPAGKRELPARSEQALARRAGSGYWLAVALIVAGVLAIVPLYIRESVDRARLDALEKFADTIGCRAGIFRPRPRPPTPTPTPSCPPPRSSRDQSVRESADGVIARRSF